MSVGFLVFLRLVCVAPAYILSCGAARRASLPLLWLCVRYLLLAAMCGLSVRFSPVSRRLGDWVILDLFSPAQVGLPSAIEPFFAPVILLVSYWPLATVSSSFFLADARGLIGATATTRALTRFSSLQKARLSH